MNKPGITLVVLTRAAPSNCHQSSTIRDTIIECPEVENELLMTELGLSSLKWGLYLLCIHESTFQAVVSDHYKSIKTFLLLCELLY